MTGGFWVMVEAERNLPGDKGTFILEFDLAVSLPYGDFLEKPHL